MIRRLFNFATGLSLLVAIVFAVAAVWGRVSWTEFVSARAGVLHQLTIGSSAVTWIQIEGWPRDEKVVRLKAENGITIRIPKWSPGSTWDDWLCAGSTRTAIIGSVDPWGHESPTEPGRMTAVWLMTRRCVVLSSMLPLAWVIWRFWPRRKTGRGFEVEPMRAQG